MTAIVQNYYLVNLVMQIQINSLYKSFEKGKQTLKDINLSVEKGEVVSILGPSGCGKSTILRILAKLETKDSGEIKLNSSMSFVFQQPLLLDWRTALENVLLPLELSKTPKSQALLKAQECLEMVCLKDSMQQYPEQLSGGMKMRVSLARALVSDPEILLLDEPFAALDEMTREKLNEELLELNRTKQLTMLFVTHNIFEAVFISDRIIVLGEAPAEIIKEINVPLARPRKIEERGSPDFAKLVGEVQTALRKEL